MEFENSLLKPNLFFDPTTSKYFSKKHSKLNASGILISFVKFNGKFLRLNAKIGNFKSNDHLDYRYFEYQFVFIENNVIDIKWVEKKY